MSNNQDTRVNTSDSVENDITEDYFRMLVAEYMKLNDELKALGKVVRAKREKQGNISQIIMQYTSEHGIEGIALDGQYTGMELVTDIQEKEQNIGRKGLMDIISDKLKDDPNKLKSIMDAIDNEKEVVEIEKVKISKVGGKKQGDKGASEDNKKGKKKVYGAPMGDEEQQNADAILLGDK